MGKTTFLLKVSIHSTFKDSYTQQRFIKNRHTTKDLKLQLMCSWWFVNTEETFALLLSKVPPNPSIMLREHNYNKSTVYACVQLSIGAVNVSPHEREEWGKKIGIKILSTLLAARIKS